MFIAPPPFLVRGNYVLLSIYGSMAALTFVHKGIEKAKLKGGEKDEDHAHLVVKVRKRNLKRGFNKYDDLEPDVGQGSVADKGNVGPSAVVHGEEREQDHHLRRANIRTRSM